RHGFPPPGRIHRRILGRVWRFFGAAQGTSPTVGGVTTTGVDLRRWMIVSVISQQLRTPALLVVLVAIVGLGAASAMAALSASSAPKPFELVLDEEWEYGDFPLAQWTRTFTAKAPFCESGSVVEVDLGVRRFACADGSGSITLDIGYPWAQFDGDPRWSILEG